MLFRITSKDKNIVPFELCDVIFDILGYPTLV